MKTFEQKIDGFKPIYKGIPPFMSFDKGFGFYGVLLEQEETGKLQCHLCGKCVFSIAKHLYHRHKQYSAKDYRIETGLNLTTPIVSEKTRKLIKNNFLNLDVKKQQEVISRLRNLNKKLHKNPKRQRESKASLQLNNSYGTCPEQVKSQFYEIYFKLKRIPKWSELTGKLRYIIESRFGAYEEALVSWGIPRKEYREHVLNGQENARKVRESKDYFPKYSKKDVEDQYIGFFELKKRLPTWGEVKMYGMAGRIPFYRVFKCQKTELELELKQNYHAK